MSEVNLDDPAIQEAVQAAAAKLAEDQLKSTLDKETSGLKTKNRELLGKVKDFEKRLEALPEDFDPERYAQLTKDAEERERAEAERKGEYDKLLVQQREKFEADLTASREEGQQWKGRFEQYRLETELLAELGSAEAFSELAMPHVRAQTRLVEDDGKFVVRVVDESGDPRIGEGSELMTVKELLAEMKATPRYAPLFKGSGAAGSGAAGGSGGGNQPVKNPWMKGQINVTEQGRILREKPELASKLKQAAGVK